MIESSEAVSEYIMTDNFIGWFVLYVKSNWEYKIHKSLLERGLDSFLPQVKVIRQWSDRRKIILAPLFPSYVFVYVKSHQEFYKALSLEGSFGYIRFGKEYAKIPENEINQIKFLIDEKKIIELKTNVQLPKIGETKKFNSGPLIGQECEVLRVDNVNKILVRINSLRLIVTATISPNLIV